MDWSSDAKYNQPAEAGRVFTSSLGDVTIHRIHGLDGWYLSCAELRLDGCQLHGETFDEAVQSARSIISNRLDRLNSIYCSFLADGGPNKIGKYMKAR